MGIRHLFHKSNINLTYKTYGKLQRLYDIYKSHKQDTVTQETNQTALRHLLNHIIPNLPKLTTHNYPLIPTANTDAVRHNKSNKASPCHKPLPCQGQGFGVGYEYNRLLAGSSSRIATWLFG